jgi:serine protease Do
MMNKDSEILSLIDAYLRDELSVDEVSEFEERMRKDPDFAEQVARHKDFVKRLTEYGNRVRLMSEMDNIHDQMDIHTLKEEVNTRQGLIRRVWAKYRVSAAIAATVALIAVFGTLSFTGYFSETISTNYSQMRREINSIKRSQNALIKNINGQPPKGPTDPGQYGGTGFALSSNGYVITNYHVIRGADSVYVQNSHGEAYKVKPIYIDPAYDIAVLQITDPDFKLASLPYTFRKSASDVGQDVYTIGFPRDDQVYGEGYVSSRNGYAGDTIAYQVSIPVNPGNSGGPLLDSKGNVIGIINGKQTFAEGATFAIKSTYILQSVGAIPSDSLEEKLILNKRNTLAGLNRREQIKKLEPYIFMVKVY